MKRTVLAAIAVGLSSLAVARPLAAQNLLPNPDFDDPVDATGGWGELFPAVGDFAWNAADATGCVSGSALGTNMTGGQNGEVSFNSCATVAAVAGQSYSAGVSVFFLGGQVALGRATIEQLFFSDAGCFGAILHSDFSPEVESTTAGGWVDIAVDEGVAPVGALSVGVRVAIIKYEAPGTLEMRFDRAFIVPRAGAFFGDGFEIGSTCRWSNAVP